MEQKRYYLNNISDKEIKITLTTQRSIKPKSSLPLNNKDVVIYKKLKSARLGKKSMIHLLKLSTIPIEKDTNYINANNVKEDKKVDELLNDNPDVRDFLNGTTDGLPEGTTEISEEDAEKAEEAARLALEEKAKAEEEAIAKEKAKIAKRLQKEAKKEGKTYDEESLQKEVEEIYAKEVAEAAAKAAEEAATEKTNAKAE